MAQPYFGITIQPLEDEQRPPAPGVMSTVGLIATAPAADGQAFPVGTAVRPNSRDASMVGKLGAGGTAADAIALLNANTGAFSADVMMVRIEPGEAEAEAMANAVQALAVLRDAAASVGATPRLVMIPGLTHQQQTPADANAVVAALDGPLQAMRAHAVVTGPHSTLQAFLDWRETFASRRIIPIETWARVGNPAEARDSAPAVVGMLVQRDALNGGRPFRSVANRPVQGIVGPSRPVPFSLTDGAVEGQLILSAGGGIIVRGEIGVDAAIGEAGNVLIATDTAADDALWRFYPVSRGRDYIELMFLRTLRDYLGRYNLTGHTVQMILNSMTTALEGVEADGDILGFEVGFEPAKNDPDDLRQGRFTVYFKAEEAPTLRHLTVDSGRLRPALDALLEDLQAAAA